MSDEDKKQLGKMQKDAADLKGRKLTPEMPSSKLPLGMTAIYLLSLHECDPRVVVQQVKQPMLILQGEPRLPGNHGGFRRVGKKALA